MEQIMVRIAWHSCTSLHSACCPRDLMERRRRVGGALMWCFSAVLLGSSSSLMFSVWSTCSWEKSYTGLTALPWAYVCQNCINIPYQGDLTRPRQ